MCTYIYISRMFWSRRAFNVHIYIYILVVCSGPGGRSMCTYIYISCMFWSQRAFNAHIYIYISCMFWSRRAFNAQRTNVTGSLGAKGCVRK